MIALLKFCVYSQQINWGVVHCKQVELSLQSQLFAGLLNAEICETLKVCL